MSVFGVLAQLTEEQIEPLGHELEECNVIVPQVRFRWAHTSIDGSQMVNEAREQLSPSFRYLPLSIHLETKGGIASPLVLRGTPLPAERVQTFSTAEDDQVTVELSILAGERPLASKCIKLGKFQLTGIPPAPQGKPAVRVTIKVDRKCVVSAATTVDGTPLATQQQLPIPTKYLRDKFLEKLRVDAAEHKAEDEQAVSLIEAANKAEQLIDEAEVRLADQLANKSGLLDVDAIAKAIAQAGQALESGDPDRIREATRLLQISLAPKGGPDLGVFGLPGFSDIFAARPAYRQSATKQQVPKPSAQPRPRITRPRVPRGDVTRDRAGRDSLGGIFGGGEFTLDPNLCFVLMPLNPTFQPIYDDHIKPLVHGAGLTCQRADEIPGAGLITRDIWEKINRARFLIADLTGQNPNVFYEVGLAHALSKDVLLITQTLTDVPFDLRAIRCLTYTYTPPGMVAFEAALKTTIDVLMRSG